MKVIKFQHVSLSRLRLPGTIRELAQDPDLDSLAMALRQVGQANPIMIRKDPFRLIHGHDRAAAAIRAGVDRLWVCWVDCTDDEAEAMSISENLHRRNSQELGESQATAARLIELLSRRVTAEDPVTELEGKPVHPRVLARRAAAQQMGLSPETVRAYESRERKRQGLPPLRAGRPPKSQLEKPPINTLGVVADDAFLRAVREVSVYLEAAARKVRDARGHLQAITTPLPKVSLQSLIGSATELLKQLNGLAPATVCPYCKGIPELAQSCQACSSAGWFGASQSGGVPRELLDDADPRVVDKDGGIVSVGTLFPDRKPKRLALFG